MRGLAKEVLIRKASRKYVKYENEENMMEGNKL